MRRPIALIVGIALTVAACSAGADEEPAGPGRLAILDEDGNVAVVEPEGTVIDQLTDDASATTVYLQPTWSPDGTSLAYSRGTTTEAGIVITDVDAAKTATVETAGQPFYLSWSLDGEQLATLGNSPLGGIELTVVAADGGAIRADTGQPYYFSWGDEASMVVHIGLDGLFVVDGEGAEQDWPLGAPSAFRAPIWLDDGVVYLERGTDLQTLVLVPQNGAARPLARFPGGASFVASPAGDRLALQAVAPGAEGGDIASAGRLVAAQAAPELPANRLIVLELDSLTWTRVTSDPVLAYWWSPTGNALLVLAIDDLATGTLEWRVWDGDELGAPVQFVPHTQLAHDVVPFFDQYAQSLSFWSPGGDAYAFAGRVGDEQGIFVVDVAAAGTPKKIAEGTWVAWGD